MTMLSHAHRRNPCVRFWTLTLTLLLSLACHAQIQQTVSTAPDEITQTLKLIQTAKQEQLPDDRIGYLWAVLAAQYRKADNFTAAEDAYFKSFALLDHTPAAARNYAVALDNLAMLYLTYGKLNEAEAYSKKGAKIRSGLDYPLDQARSEAHMAQIDLARHKFKAAENGAAHAFEVMTRLNDTNPLDMISTLNSLAIARCSQKACAQGIEDAQRSVNLARNSFGDDSSEVAHSMMAYGFAEWKLNKVKEADETMRSAIQTIKLREGPESVSALLAMTEYRNYLNGVHRVNEAEDLTQQLALAMQKQGTTCATCVNVHTLSNAMR